MDFTVVFLQYPKWLEGLWLTFQLTVLSVVIGFVIALLIAIVLVGKNRIAIALCKGYVYFFRGTPFLVQLYLIYNGLAGLAWVRDSFVWVVFKEAYFCALLALVLNTGAYGAEILRGAFINTPREEVDAAYSFGMTNRQALWRIIIPSALRRAFPAYSNEVILMLHATSLVSVITLMDITGAARLIYERYFNPFETFIIAGAIYLIITIGLTWVFRASERKWARHLQP